MQPDTANTAILLNHKPEIYATFCCQGCGGKTRKMEDKRPRMVEGKGGRITKVTRCIYCEGNKAPKNDLA